MASIALEKVRKCYGDVEVIHGIDLDIEPGEFAVFVGPSGCGKSTLLRMIAGLETISSGDLLIGGQQMNDVPAAKRGIAMVFQNYALYPHMNVYKNLAFGLETAKLPRHEIDTRIKQTAEILRIGQLLERRPRQLSGGQRQRVAIGRAIVREPRIFLFDEPLSNLDADLRVQMRVEIAKLHKKLGNTMIYVTHDQVEAMTMADKIVVLNSGVVEQVGAPLDLYNSPVNRFVAGFIGSPKMNFLAVTSDGAGLKVTGRTLNLQRSSIGVVALGVRPEHIGLKADAGTKLTDIRVELVENLGGQTVVYATTFDNQPLTIVLEGQQPVMSGSTLEAHVDPAHIHLFDADGQAIP